MLILHIQNVTNYKNVPSRWLFKRWLNSVLAEKLANKLPLKPLHLTIRLVDESESADLNSTYRHKKGPTNVLSFPFENMLGMEQYYLGDLVICAPLVSKEAAEQHKEEKAHWAHLTIHGLLHLLGYDHVCENDATVMEGLEVKILKKLGFKDPY